MGGRTWPGCEDPAPTTPHVHTHTHAHPHTLMHTQRAADGVLLHRGLQSPGTFQAQPESPGSKFGMGNPDPISSARTHMPPSSLLACSHGREGMASVLSPCDALILGWWAAYSRETSCAPKPGNSQGVRSSGREKFLQTDSSPQTTWFLGTFPTSLPGSPRQHCSLPSRRAPVMPVRCGCCPGRVPRRSPPGGSCGFAPASPRPARPDPAHLQGETGTASAPCPPSRTPDP